MRGTLHKGVFTFMTIFHLIIRIMKNVSHKRCRAHQSKHFMISKLFFLNRVVYEIMWNNMIVPDRPQVII